MTCVWFRMGASARHCRDIEAIARECGVDHPVVRNGDHVLVYDASGRLLASIASTPRSRERALLNATRDIRRSLKPP